MKKEKIMSMLMMSSVLLSPAPLLADEVTIIGGTETGIVESSQSTEPSVDKPVEESGTVVGDENVTVPTTKADSGTGIIKEPSVPSQPTEPSVDKPVEESGKVVGDENATVPTTKADSGTGIIKEPSVRSQSTEPVSPTQPSVTEEEKTNQSTELVSEEVKKAEENTGASSTGQAIPITDSVIETPIVSNTGHVVVSTQDGNVVVQTKAGTELKRAEEIGAIKQSDGTVAVKTSSGQLKVLPKTGEEMSIVLTVMGLMVLFIVFISCKKETIVNWLKSRIKK